MKKVFIILASLVGLVLLAAVLVPVIFKDDIQKALDEQLDQNLNAEVYYDTDAFGVSLFKSFPNLTVSLESFGVTGVDEFEGDTLLGVQEFSITVDIMSAIKGERIVIKNVSLNQPLIQVLVLPDGSANYDIAVSSSEEEVVMEETDESDGESADISISVENWEINDGNILYIDETLPFYITLFGFNHQGSGDFTLDVFDMVTSTTVEQLSLGYDGDEYISNKRFMADLTLGMDLANMKFTFKDNRLGLNEFGFGLEGFVNMPGDDIEMEINFAGKDISMQNILSLIPGLYQEYLEGLDAGGNISFDGYVKGVYNENSMPQIAMNFAVDQGRISYSEYPIPMEDITIRANFDYPSADLSESSFAMDQFSMLVDDEKLTASLLFKDFEDYFWDFKMDGNVDLEKITKIIPMEGMDLKGKINAALQTSGRMSDLEAERYDQLPTSGSMSITGFSYLSPDLPQGFGIAECKASFNPAEIVLSTFEGNAGNTDLNMSGRLENYLQYALSDNEPIIGKLDFSSSLVDINEWMVPMEEEEEVVEEDTSAMEVVQVPTNIDFELNSSISLMKYDNLDIKDFAGSLVIKNGAIQMNGVSFNLLDGGFVMNGSYQTFEDQNPKYLYDMKITDLSIPNAYQAFNTVQQMAPFAERMTGKFSSGFQITGELGSDMMPIYETIFGNGDLLVSEGAINDVKLLAAASKVTKAAPADGTVTLNNVKMKVEIVEGNVFVEPFDVKMGGYTTTISGSNSLDGSLDYIMTMKDVSTGAVGQAVSGALASLTGTQNLVSSKVNIDMGVQGTFDEPQIKLLGVSPAEGSSGNSAKTAATQKLQETKAEATAKIQEAKQDAIKKVEEEKEAAVMMVTEKKEEAKDEVKETVDDAKKKLGNKLKGLGGKKKDGGGGGL